tara:strand:- start:5495 stop:5650 length:156 start_codon:yes stop_codon:yes gene_type:complete
MDTYTLRPLASENKWVIEGKDGIVGLYDSKKAAMEKLTDLKCYQPPLKDRL